MLSALVTHVSTALFASMLLTGVAFGASTTYVLDVELSGEGSCPAVYQQLWTDLVKGQEDSALDLRWELDCGATQDGHTAIAVQIVAEAASAEAEPLLAQYLAARDGMAEWGTALHFRRALRLDQNLTFTAGVIEDSDDWQFKPIDAATYTASYASDAAYHEFYSTLTDAFWFADVDGFTRFVAQLFGDDFARSYRAKILPEVNAVLTTTKLQWIMQEGAPISSRMPFDIMHDCRVRDNGHCA